MNANARPEADTTVVTSPSTEMPVLASTATNRNLDPGVPSTRVTGVKLVGDGHLRELN